MKRMKLRTHQNDGVSFLTLRKGGLLNWDMRLGKTLTVLRTILHLKVRGPVLVVCPYSAMIGWEKDCILEGLRVVKVIGTRNERLAVLEGLSNDLMVCIINKEGHLVVPEIMYIHFSAIIIDESHSIKNPSSMITKFYLSNFKYVEFRFCLSGTPINKNEIEYFTQLKFLGAFEEYSNYYHFRFACCRPVMFDWVLNEKGIEKMKNQISKYVSILTLEMAGYDNNHEEQTRYIERNSKFKDAYKKLRDEFVLEIEDEKICKTKFASQKYIWMRRICGGFVPESETMFFKEKFIELEDLLSEELRDQQCVIWSSFVQEILFLSNNIPRSECIYGNISIAERKCRIERFRAGLTRNLIVMPQTLSEGVDLSNSSINIYYSQPISLILKKQTKQRIYKVGSNRRLLTINLVMEKTVDESILNSFEKNESTQDLWKRIIKDMQYANQS